MTDSGLFPTFTMQLIIQKQVSSGLKKNQTTTKTVCLLKTKQDEAFSRVERKSCSGWRPLPFVPVALTYAEIVIAAASGGTGWKNTAF